MGQEKNYVTLITTPKERTAPTTIIPSEITNRGISIKLNKIVQDDDSLRIYVTYKNETADTIGPFDIGAKVESAGKQYLYDSDFNLQRWYLKDGVAHAQKPLKPGEVSDSIIFMKPIVGVNSVNISFNVGLEYELVFHNVKVNIIK